MATTEDPTPHYQCVLHRNAEPELSDVPPDTRDKLVTIIKTAAQNEEPTKHNMAEQLRECPLFRFKAGKYRALCALRKPELQVLLVGHRKRVYDRMDEAVSRM